MDVISRLLIIIIGVICAAGVAAVSIPFLAFLDPLVREAILARLMGTLFTALGAPPASPQAAALLMQLMHLSTLAICIAPVVLAALIGELARFRSWLWYACCSGILAAAMPFDPHPWSEADGDAAAHEATAMMLELRFMLLFFIVGLIAGTIYWVIAGRNAGEATPELEGKAI